MIEVRTCKDVEEFLAAGRAIAEYGAWDLTEERARRFIRNHPEVADSQLAKLLGRGGGSDQLSPFAASAAGSAGTTSWISPRQNASDARWLTSTSPWLAPVSGYETRTRSASPRRSVMLLAPSISS